MMSSALKKIHDILPRWREASTMTVNSAIDRRQRRGGKYQESLNEFQRLQWASSGEIHAWRLKRFRKVFREAAASIIYYNRVFRLATDAGYWATVEQTAYS